MAMALCLILLLLPPSVDHNTSFKVLLGIELWGFSARRRQFLITFKLHLFVYSVCMCMHVHMA
jgi:hypothetical protein